VNRTRERIVDGELLRSMASVINHRGPDDEGIYLKGAVGLAHKRLSILDLSPGLFLTVRFTTFWTYGTIFKKGDIPLFLERILRPSFTFTKKRG
jgi:hypothetical protein